MAATSIRGFGAEHALKARADELHAYHAFPFTGSVADMDHLALGFEILFASAQGMALRRDANLQAGADGYVKPRSECGSAAAKIFAGGIFFKGKSTRVAAADAQRQANGDSTFGPLAGYALDDWAHRLASPRQHACPQRNAPRSRQSLAECAPNARFFAVRCRSPRRA